jgi:uncharacterized protein (TIGR02646 family)
MIQVDRNRVPMPQVLGPDPEAPGPRETAEAAAFYDIPLEKRRERYFPFKAYRHRSVQSALAELFHGKCAYCESKTATFEPLDVDHFRPKSGVVGEAGEHYPDLYWWLANEWTNLYPVCADCGRAQETFLKRELTVRSGRGNRFPLEDESQRATRRGEESRERPLLLDPCVDDPGEHLVFTDDGLVVSETLRGQTTIAVLDLNRSGLVDARRAAVRQVLSQVDRVMLLSAQTAGETPHPLLVERLEGELRELKQLAEPDQEYAALKRQLVRAALDALAAQLEAAPPGAVPEEQAAEVREFVSKAPAVKVTQAEQERARESYAAFERSLEDYSLEEASGLDRYFVQRRLIERIEIRNLKALGEVALDLTRSEGGGTPWTMFLGENATGKSTILQAVALTLVGEKYFSQLAASLGLHPANYIRWGCDSGQVKVYLSGFTGPFVLTFRPDAVEFESPLGGTTVVAFSADGPLGASGGVWHAKVFTLAYGATRLLPRKTGAEPYGQPYARVDNLFNPFQPLVNATPWLLGLPEEQFHLTRLALKQLLGLREEDEIYKQDGRVWIQAHGSRVPLESLSDGYQSVVALTADILEVVLNLWPEPGFAEGIVLLDEVGAHLHPTWKMRVVSSLRSFLPRMQFIVSTHEPLCLRGLYDGEIVLMRRDAAYEVHAITDLPSVEGLRVDQLLTSEHFGLLSTRSLQTEELFTEYYGLLAQRELTGDQEARLEELERLLHRQEYMGTTRRERLMLQAIDRYLASEPEFLGRPEHSRRREQLDGELDGILAGDRGGE